MKFPRAFVSALFAALISPASATVTMDYVNVGNAGNAADSTGHGAVDHVYRIGKYEVTNAQYAEFLNAKASTDTYALYNTSMASYGITRSGSAGSYTYSVTAGMANRPVVYVSWFDAARFTNWVSNGQGAASTETGSYTLNGATTGSILPNTGATVYLPSWDEWYKAAYYNGTTSTYSLYPNGQNTIAAADANFGGNVGHSTDVGTYSSDPSAYGTFDQGGNVSEWTDAVGSNDTRGYFGGNWYQSDAYLASDRPTGNLPEFEYYAIGFRVATTAAVPETTASSLALLAGCLVLARRKR